MLTAQETESASCHDRTLDQLLHFPLSTDGHNSMVTRKNEIQTRKEKSSGKTHKEMTLKLFKLESLNVP